VSIRAELEHGASLAQRLELCERRAAPLGITTRGHGGQLIEAFESRHNLSPLRVSGSISAHRHDLGPLERYLCVLVEEGSAWSIG